MSRSASGFLARWGEVLLTGVLAGWFIWVFASRLWRGDGWGTALFALPALLLALWFLAAFRRLALKGRDPQGAGLVRLDEGRIGYLGPLGGGFVALDALIRIEAIGQGRERSWHLVPEDGLALIIPVDAPGAEGLGDLLTALPGFSLAAAAEAIGRGEGRGHGPRRIVIWQRPGAASYPALAPPPRAG